MLIVVLGFLLFPAGAKGSVATECEASGGKTLFCKFSRNINSTRTDFAVFFCLDSGGEEKLVDCGWMDERLHCIRQEGFDCKQPVSDNAVITVPTRFVNKIGSYKCSTDGYSPEEIASCRFPATEHVAACDANTTLSGPHVILNCRFSFTVDSFSVKQNSTVVASFKKSECQSSGPCRHVPGDSRDMFNIKLEMPDYPYGEYLCHPDHNPSFGLQVNGCSVNMKSRPHTSTSTSFPLPVVLSISYVLSFVSALALFMFIRRQLVKLRVYEKPKSRSSPTAGTVFACLTVASLGLFASTAMF